jgi:predicted RNase H-like nuclease
MSLQSFYLLPKVRQVDAWMTPDRQLRVFEAHPELVWARLAGAPVLASKRTLEGQQLRAGLLPWAVPCWTWRRSEVQPDDVLDAMVMALCAVHREQGLSQPVSDPEWDERGLLMEMYG